jgi:hypothetical protein
VSLYFHRKYNFFNLFIMKKQILNIGKALSRAEQKQVFGGAMMQEDDGGGGISATCYCGNGPRLLSNGADCTWCGQVCSMRGGYTGICIEW